MAGRDDTIHNEQIKLAATALNNVGVASVVTGVIVPMIARSSTAASMGGGRYWGWFMLLWFVIGVGFHLFARRALKELRA